jgi:hypothetical protein
VTSIAEKAQATCAALMRDAMTAERFDVLAFLRKRQANARKIGERNPEEAERARIIAEQIGIEIEMIEQGLHVGDVDVAAALEGAE